MRTAATFVVLLSLIAADTFAGRADLPTPIQNDAHNLVSSSTASVLARETAGPDTFVLYGGPGTLEGKFENLAGAPDWQGWTSADLTEMEFRWQRSTFNAENLNSNGVGNHAMWCGQDAIQQPGWVTPPGYGNGWNEILLYESGPLVNPSVAQTVSLNFIFNIDITDLSYDNFIVEYDSAGAWMEVLRESRSNKDGANQFPAPGLLFSDYQTRSITYAGNDYGVSGNDGIRIRLVFMSDGAWSDEGGLAPTIAGAVQLDDITLTHTEFTGTEDFEGAGPYLFEPSLPPFAGDFADIFVAACQPDPCVQNYTPAVGFVDAGQPVNNDPFGTGPNSTGGVFAPATWCDGQTVAVVNYNGGLSQGLVPVNMEVRSPVIAWDLPGSADDAVEIAGVRLSFDVYRNLPLLNGVFFVWHIRSREVGSFWPEWKDRNFVYYGQGLPPWDRQEVDVSDLMEPSVGEVQIALGVLDLASWFGFPGLTATDAPMFDNVTLKKYRLAGPVISTQERHLANDAFPRTTTMDVGTQVGRDALDVAFDMADDVSSGSLLAPGDSIVVGLEALIPGSSEQDVRMVWALARNPLFEDTIRSVPARTKDENVVAIGPVWTGEVLGEVPRDFYGWTVPGRVFFDLPDVDFLYPGDRLHYYIQATDDASRISTLPNDISNFGVFDAYGESRYDARFVVRALPSVHSPTGDQAGILIVDEGDDPVVSSSMRLSMRQAGYVEHDDFDMYVVRDPDNADGNGIGGSAGHGAEAAHLAGYETIIYLGGTRKGDLLADGNPSGWSDKADDLGVLTAWQDLAGQRNMIHFGDNVASATESLSGVASDYVAQRMNLVVLDEDVRPAIDDQTKPLVQTIAPLAGRDFRAYGDCPGINRFDHIQPGAGAYAGHGFLSPSWTIYSDSAASVIFDRLQGLDRKVDITFPFSTQSVYRESWGRAPVQKLPLTRLLEDMFTYLGLPWGTRPVDVPAFIEPTMRIAPNPFNPRTTIQMNLPRAAKTDIEVFNLRGERVRTLHSGILPAGEHPIVWDGTDGRGKSVASGVYVVRAKSNSFELKQKVAVVK